MYNIQVQTSKSWPFLSQKNNFKICPGSFDPEIREKIVPIFCTKGRKLVFCGWRVYFEIEV